MERALDELINAGGVTRRCVSLAQGTLSPDMRVNYEFGLVLGVDEFRQEQLYFLHKEYLHHRALHGYGTVSGLRVLPEAEGSSDVKLTVSPGIGIDQCGRVFTVPNDQCAYLRAWFQRQQEEEALSSGPQRLYVVATYDECPDALVSIAGQPCSSSQQTQVPSRIRDAFHIALRWAPPPMPRWDAILCFAELMADVRIEAGLSPGESDKAEIIRFVRLLDDCEALRAERFGTGQYGPSYPPGSGETPPYGGYPPPDGEGGRYLLLPEDTARQDLDDIFRVWVTEVRPRLTPDLIDCAQPGGEPLETGVLLAAIDVDLSVSEGALSVSLPEEDDAVDDSGRPYLLSTQAIQELMGLGGSGGDARPQQPFATLHVRDTSALLLWVHHPEPLGLDGSLSDTMEIFANGSPLSGTVEAVDGADNVFLIRTNEPIGAGVRVELRLRLNTVRVVGPAFNTAGLSGAALRALQELEEARALSGSTALLASLDLFGVGYIGREGDTLTLYTVASEIPDVRALTTIHTLTDGETSPRLRIRFNTAQPVTVPEGSLAATIIRGTNERPLNITLRPEGGTTAEGAQTWTLQPINTQLQHGDTVRLRFNVSEIRQGGTVPLLVAMNVGGYTYVGYDGGEVVEVLHVVEVPPTSDGGGGLTIEQVRELLRQVRTLPFATITPLRVFRRNRAEFELWFHPQQRATSDEGRLDELNVRIYMEAIRESVNELAVTQVPIVEEGVQRFSPIHYRVQVNLAPLLELGNTQPSYARFVFPLDEGNRITTSDGDFENIRAYMEQLNIKLDGSFIRLEETDEDALVVYVRFDPLLLNRGDFQ
jgi:hypothetical protein